MISFDGGQSFNFINVHMFIGDGGSRKMMVRPRFQLLELLNACANRIVGVAIKSEQILVRPWPEQPEQPERLPRPCLSMIVVVKMTERLPVLSNIGSPLVA